MSENGQLLDEARSFCDPETGEVVQRIPEELMKRLREAKLVRGIPGKANQRTESNATWFVFLDDGIRERILARWREANRARKRNRKNAAEAAGRAAANGNSAESPPSGQRGLTQFRQRKKSNK